MATRKAKRHREGELSEILNGLLLLTGWQQQLLHQAVGLVGGGQTDRPAQRRRSRPAHR